MKKSWDNLHLMDTGIVQKLSVFLKQHPKLEEEHEVLYFMVQVRKVLEKDKKGLSLLRFYCNWIAHSSLDRKTTTQIIETGLRIDDIDKLNAREVARRLASEGKEFFKINSLKNELRDFLERYGLPVVTIDSYWTEFMTAILSILAECPVSFRSDAIRRMEVVKKSAKIYSYKFTLGNTYRHKPIVKLKL